MIGLDEDDDRDRDAASATRVTFRCAFRMPSGQGCRAAPPRGATWCLWHDPARAAEAAAARRAGRARLTRDVVTEAAFLTEGLATVGGLRRVLDIALADTLTLRGHEVARLRLLIEIVRVGIRLRDVGDIEWRLEALELLLPQPQRQAPSVLRADTPGGLR